MSDETRHDDEWVEERLREQPSPPPSPEFAERLRRAFVRGELGGLDAAEGGGLTDESDESGVSRSRTPFEPRKGATVEERDRSLERRIAAEPLAEPARAAFQADLRKRFVQGTFEGESPAGGPAVTPVRRRGPRALRDARDGSRSAGPRWLVPAVGLAAAAVLLFVLLPRDEPQETGPVVVDSGTTEVESLETPQTIDPVEVESPDVDSPVVEPVVEPVLPDPDRWHLVEYRGGGFVLVDGDEVATEDTPALDTVLADAGRLETGKGRLELAYADRFVMELQPNTSVRMEDLGPEDARLFVESGELFLTTLDGHRGRIVMATPDAEVLVTGTTLGVLALGENGSCVCVVEGDVVVTKEDVTEGDEVSDLTTYRIFGDGTHDAHGFPDLTEDGHDHQRRLDEFYRRRH